MFQTCQHELLPSSSGYRLLLGSSWSGRVIKQVRFLEAHVLRSGEGDLTHGPTSGSSWLMWSLAPITQPNRISPFTLAWLLIGAAEGRGEIHGGPDAGCLPKTSRLQWAYLQPCVCTVIGQMESISPRKASVASSWIYQDHTQAHGPYERQFEGDLEGSQRSTLTDTHPLAWNN